MVLIILKSLSWFLAVLPESAVAFFCQLLGDLLYYIPNSRRYAVLSNLHHAFPERSRKRLHRIARMSLRQMVEMFIFALASGSFSKERMHKVLSFTEKDLIELTGIINEKGGMGLIPHVTLNEAIPLMPAFIDTQKKLYAIYRPLDLKSADKYVKDTRSRFGLELLSRKEGLIKIFKLIQKGEYVSLHFEQNAGDRGVLITSFDRLASATDLPGLIAQRTGCNLNILSAKRTGFWRATLHVERLPQELSVEETTIWCNNWLENYLKSSDEACADWLWGHRRWHTQDKPSRRFRLEHKKDYLDACLKANGQTELPRRTRFWFRMPNWLGDVVMAIPLLQAIRKARPDVEITLLAQKHFAVILEKMELADRIIAIPSKKEGGYFSFFRNLRHKYPDCYTLFTNSTRGDLEAKLSSTPQRFGMERPGKKRRFLTHTWKIPADLDESKIHQTRVWEQFFQHFGLKESLDFTPVRWTRPASENLERDKTVLGLICGTENDPSKRWPVSCWRQLVDKILENHPDFLIELYGTVRDRDITDQVAQGFDAHQVNNLAGETNLLEFVDHLKLCKILIGNDTGGIHLANCIGVPVIPVFGPTNPVRTGPIFEAPVKIIQPPDAASTGGAAIDQVTPEQVIDAVETLLSEFYTP